MSAGPGRSSPAEVPGWPSAPSPGVGAFAPDPNAPPGGQPASGDTERATLATLAWIADHDVPCPACGYNCRGLTRLVCPECGQQLPDTLRSAAAAPGPAALRRELAEYVRDRDVFCPHCRANLRGLDQLRCRSCGGFVTRWMLKHSGVRWSELARVEQVGVALLLGICVVMGLAFVLLCISILVRL